MRLNIAMKIVQKVCLIKFFGYAILKLKIDLPIFFLDQVKSSNFSLIFRKNVKMIIEHSGRKMKKM